MTKTYHKPFDGKDGKWYILVEDEFICRTIEFPSKEAAEEVYERENPNDKND